MIIGVDGNLLCGKKTGMGTVVHHVIKRWKSTDNTSIILYVPGDIDEEYKILLWGNGIIVKNYAYTSYPVWEQIILPREVKKDHVDVLWCPYNTAPLFCNCKTVVTINDVIYMTEKLNTASTFYKKSGMLYRRLIVPKASHKAAHIITISNFARKEIFENIKNIKANIDVVYLGVDLNNRSLKDEKDFYEKNGIRNNYILGFGSMEKRKNSLGLIKAYEKLDKSIRSGFQLVLFGFRGYEDSQDLLYIKEHNLTNDVVILGYVSEEEKTSLYRNSRMFVFPTFSEGFGIPVLEAYANKTPVITSNSTSLPEIAGDAAILVNPENVSEIRDAMKKLIEEPEQRVYMIERGIEQRKKFDWDTTAGALLSILKGHN